MNRRKIIIVILLLVLFNVLVVSDKHIARSELKKPMGFFPLKIDEWQGLALPERPLADDQFLGVYKKGNLDVKLRLTYINSIGSKFC